MLFFTLMGIAGAPLGGFLVDKVFNGRNRPVIVIGWVLSAVFYTAIMFPAVYSRPFALMTVLLLAGLANPFLNVTLMSFAAKVFSPLVVGRVCGLWMSVSFFAGSAGVMAGSLALRATGTYELSILIIGASSVLGLVVSLFLRQSPTAPSQMGHLAFNGEKIAEEL
jgi:MFS family permease